MLNAYKNFFVKAFDFKGKSSRKDFLLVYLCNLILAVILMLGLSESNVSTISIWIIGLIIYSVVTILPSISLTTRRLRDAGFHWGWMFFSLVPTVGSIVVFVLCCFPTKT